MAQYVNTKTTVALNDIFRIGLVLCFLYGPGMPLAYSQQKYFRVYTTRDGLPSSTIPACPEAKTIFQDADGFIWLATFGGVSIYDGHKFANYSVENGTLTDDNALNFFQKAKNEIWVVESVCTDVFVNRKRIATIPLYGYLSAHYMSTRNGRILTARDGNIYEIRNYQPFPIASFSHTISRIHEIGNYFLIEDRVHDSLYLVDQTFHTIIDQQKGRMFIDRYHRYFNFNSRFSLLDTIALGKGHFSSLPAPAPINKFDFAGNKVLDFLPDRDGYWWIVIAGKKGVLRIDPEGHSRFFQIITNNFISLLEDRDGNIWIPGDAGFYKYSNKYNDYFSEDEGLPSEYITAIAVDEISGGAWLANRNGISCIYENKVFNFTYANGSSIWSTLTTNGDSLWLINNGLFLYKISYQPNPTVKLIRKWEPHWRPDDFVDYTTFCSDNRGMLFLNKSSAGLFYITSDGTLHKILGAGLSTFYVDKDELWTCEAFGNITRWKIRRGKDSIRLQLLQRYTQVQGNVIRCIASDSAGNLWMGTTFKGVMKFEKQKNDSFIVRNYGTRNGVLNPWVLKISINQKGEVLAGTMGGVFRFHEIGDSVQIEDISARLGDVHTAWDIARDKKENLWLATPMGAVHVRNDLYKTAVAPNVFFTHLSRNNLSDSSVFQNITPQYRYNENNLAFEFTAASYRNEDKVRYTYQLVKDNDSVGWSTPEHIHAVSLVSLSPGTYKMKLKAVTEEGVWSTSPAQFQFVIMPPFWNTWWFRLIAIGVIVVVASYFYRHRINQIKKLFAVRTKISRDLHDEIGSTLSGIGLISEMAKQQLEYKNSLEVKKSLDKISDNSGEMLTRMSDIVWAINPGNDSFEKVIKRLKSYAKNTTDPLGIYLHFNSEKDIERYNLDMQKRSNIYLICKEAINNATKYSECQNLRFALRQADHHINISIADDGKGFNLSEDFEGNGLKNMHSRAQEINADLTLNSEHGKGTLINLSVRIK